MIPMAFGFGNIVLGPIMIILGFAASIGNETEGIAHRQPHTYTVYDAVTIFVIALSLYLALIF